MYTCPKCGIEAIPFWRGAFAADASPYPCPRCGAPVAADPAVTALVLLGYVFAMGLVGSVVVLLTGSPRLFAVVSAVALPFVVPAMRLVPLRLASAARSKLVLLTLRTAGALVLIVYIYSAVAHYRGA